MQPFVIAEVISSIPLVLSNIKKLIATNINSSAQSVCRRKKINRYCLINHTKGYLKFQPKSLWNEVKEKQPFLINVLNAITGESSEVENTPNHLQIKYNFIYAILMNARWHELSLYQRINTVLLVEGGCGKQVILLRVTFIYVTFF